jgi:hypothetical protein
MRAVLFEGTPEEFARVEAMFRAGSEPGAHTRRYTVLAFSRPGASYRASATLMCSCR